MTFHDRAIVLQPGEGKAVTVLGDRYTYKAVGEQTGGAYGLVETTVPASSSGPPPHVHGGEDEALYVLEGQVTVLIGDRTLTVGAGSFAFVPRGMLHTFSNPGTQAARFLAIISPAGFEKAFEEMAEVAPSAGQPPDMDRLIAIAEKYNLKIAGPPPA
ncbi:MAG: cupin domain-containing protein [Chloroflexota bacterium]|nr:cupin domain-containing protein [Chloroflexota bacterium]